MSKKIGFRENVLIGIHLDRGDLSRKKTTNHSYRYPAYRQFICSIFHRIGKGNRRVIPSCVIWKFDNVFRKKLVIVTKMVAFADDFSAGGIVENLKHWWTQLLKFGPMFGYFPRASKC